MNSFRVGILIILLNITTFGSSVNLDFIDGNYRDEPKSIELYLCALVGAKSKENNKFWCSNLDNRLSPNLVDDRSNDINIETRSNNLFSPYYYEKFHRIGGTKNLRKLKYKI